VSVGVSSPLYFFFRGEDKNKNTASAAVKSLLFQALGRAKRIPGLYEQMLEAVLLPAAENTESFPKIFALLLLYLDKAEAEVLIIDAVDECIDGYRLLRGLNTILKRTSTRIIATSRPGSLPETQKDEVELLNLEQDQTRADITAYVEYRTEAGPLSAPELRQPLVNAVVHRADGMFLWVKLLLDELASKFSQQEVLIALQKIPEGLDALYVDILTRIKATRKPSEQKFWRHVLMWVTYAYRPLTLMELFEALKLEYEEEGFLYTFDSIERAIETSCGPLVTVRSGTVQLIYSSTKEFLMSNSASWIFGISQFEGERHLEGWCLEYLDDNIFDGKIQSLIQNPTSNVLVELFHVKIALHSDKRGRKLLAQAPLAKYAMVPLLRLLVFNIDNNLEYHVDRSKPRLMAIQEFLDKVTKIIEGHDEGGGDDEDRRALEQFAEENSNAASTSRRDMQIHSHEEPALFKSSTKITFPFSIYTARIAVLGQQSIH